MVEPATIPATVRKLADHFTGELPFVIHGRTRSSGGVDSRPRTGEIDGGPSVFSTGSLYGENRIDLSVEVYQCCVAAPHTTQQRYYNEAARQE